MNQKSFTFSSRNLEESLSPHCSNMLTSEQDSSEHQGQGKTQLKGTAIQFPSAAGTLFKAPGDRPMAWCLKWLDPTWSTAVWSPIQ